jgi:hypothetical protein
VNGTLNAMVYYNFDAALQLAQQYDANLVSMNSKQRADVSGSSREDEEGKVPLVMIAIGMPIFLGIIPFGLKRLGGGNDQNK